ncbi:MAG: hypothetical protein D6797_06040 [Bdellovibrio sp.]|nr:MAG: hypothetical protein D6797_06040 [Bdellovibrio sp.]
MIKKVPAYPIEGVFTGEGLGGPLVGQIIKLTQRGLFANFSSLSVKSGKEYTVSFSLPVLKYSFNEKVKVMKVYDRFEVLPQGRKVIRLAEMHFISMTPEGRKKIREFILQIRQEPEKPE